jgi:4-hydroxy-tetrahydrodipicolinate synthase
MDVDVGSVARMVEHHARLGVRGFFLLGSNGEGPWMTNAQRTTLVKAVARYGRGRFPIAVQVTDNSPARILDNMRAAMKAGADIAVIAPPFALFNATPANVLRVYREAIRHSPLPVGIYDRGARDAVPVPDAILSAIYSEPKVVLIKDSSLDPRRMQLALAAKRRRPSLTLLNGWEFNCIPYLQAGYDGLLLGGAVFNGFMARGIMDAVRAGDIPRAERIQARMNRMMYDVYGGRKIKCWLSGEKKLLVDMGIFRTWKNCLGYTLTPSCIAAIRRVQRRDAAYLLP